MKYKIKYIHNGTKKETIEAKKFDIIVNHGQLFITFYDWGEIIAVFSNVVSVEKMEEGE